MTCSLKLRNTYAWWGTAGINLLNSTQILSKHGVYVNWIKYCFSPWAFSIRTLHTIISPTNLSFYRALLPTSPRNLFIHIQHFYAQLNKTLLISESGIEHNSDNNTWIWELPVRWELYFYDDHRSVSAGCVCSSSTGIGLLFRWFPPYTD